MKDVLSKHVTSSLYEDMSCWRPMSTLKKEVQKVANDGIIICHSDFYKGKVPANSFSQICKCVYLILMIYLWTADIKS